jgi:uncharacterized linocin/CFP29 family protein
MFYFKIHETKYCKHTKLHLEAHFDFPMETMKKCLLDEKFQKTFDSTIISKKVVQVLGKSTSSHGAVAPPVYKLSANEIIHHEIKFPMPLKNRDYVYVRRVLEDVDQCM